MNSTETAYLRTPLGMAVICGSHQGVSSVSFSRDPSTVERIPSSLARACEQLTAYFEGSRTRFEVPLYMQGTPFQQQVWEALGEIPYGETCSYRELARRMGAPEAVRAVAAANAKNPLAIFVPCHRVVGSDGALTGYAWGIWRKKWLLAHEKGLRQLDLFAGKTD